ncbi:MAG: Rdx family protein [Thaumarchaeota archaeon]|nr:Rdx family protein [Candidatus Calditenuaceae archaeon]MDW8187021.1 Rdx family protein [Nitrososphaerota archaeon]
MPQVKIVYCVPCGHLPKATQLASELLNRYGTRYLKNFSVTLDTSDGGTFDVFVDGKLVFSRKAAGGRFPTVEEIAKAIEG